MLMYALIPLVVGAIILAFVSVIMSKSEIEFTIHNYMTDMATELGKGLDRFESGADDDTAAIVIVFAIIALYVARRIANPLKSTAKAISGLADGEVNMPYDAKSNIREIRQIIYSVKELKIELNTIVGNIQGEMGELITKISSVKTSVDSCSDASGMMTNAVEEMRKSQQIR